MAHSPTPSETTQETLSDQFHRMDETLSGLVLRFDTVMTGFATMQSQIDSLQPHGPGKAPVFPSFGTPPPFGFPSSSASQPGGGPFIPPNPSPGFFSRPLCLRLL
ncbi:hypothetical protein O6H91_Y364600 [Diphasiastrum complanatum]|nr:hypothetical protein O6H91_Y364600 [Diphasiastrum complanatum]